MNNWIDKNAGQTGLNNSVNDLWATGLDFSACLVGQKVNQIDRRQLRTSKMDVNAYQRDHRASQRDPSSLP